MRTPDCCPKVWTESGRARLHPVHGGVYCAEGSTAQRLDGSMRRNWRANARLARRATLQLHWRIHEHPDLLRPRLVRLFSKSFQSYTGRHVGRRPHCHCVVTLALAARLRYPSLVRVEIAKLHRLADG